MTPTTGSAAVCIMTSITSTLSSCRNYGQTLPNMGRLNDGNCNAIHNIIHEIHI